MTANMTQAILENSGIRQERTLPVQFHQDVDAMGRLAAKYELLAALPNQTSWERRRLLQLAERHRAAQLELLAAAEEARL